MNIRAEQTIKKELQGHATNARKRVNQRYFKTTDERFGVGDVFIGVSMPDIRIIAKEFQDVKFSAIKELVQSKIHEERMCALVILVLRAKEAVKSGDTESLDAIVQFYLEYREYVNNWDLVDVSAHYILGNWILHNPQESRILYDLAHSDVIWDRRIAMVSQWIMIREGVYDHVLPLSTILLGDREDLMHKAVGWMLREYWKKDSERIEQFIWDHYVEMSRTTLRYVIVRMDREKRELFLAGSKNNST